MYKKFYRISAALAALLTSTAVLSSCGSSSDAVSPKEETTTTVTAAATAEPETTTAAPAPETTAATTTTTTPPPPETTTAATTTTEATTTTAAPAVSPSSFNTVTPRKDLTIKVSDKDYTPKVDTINYYYSALDEFHRKIYEAILDQILHTGEDYKARISVPYDLLWDFSDDFYMVYACVMDDFPEFYRYDEIICTSWNYDEDIEFDANGNYRLYVYQTEHIKDFWKEQNQLNAAAEEFLSDIDLTGSEESIALQIHDKLIALVEYDEDAPEVGGLSYAQTAYGALVDDGSINNAAVCEGYADAYSYLLRRLGIMCLPIEGGVGAGESYEEAYESATAESSCHTWNLARLDGVWSETDVTWDDTDLTESNDFVKSLLADRPELVLEKQHQNFCRTTDDMEYMNEFDKYQYYTDSEGIDYSLSNRYTVHLRASDPDAYYYKDSGSYNYAYLSSLLPRAE